MNYLSNARNLFLSAAKNLDSLTSSRMDLLEGLSKHFTVGRRTKLKPGFSQLTEKLAVCTTQTADVLVGGGEAVPLSLEVEGCDWLTLESDIRILESKGMIVLEAEVHSDYALYADVFLRIFNNAGEPTDLASAFWPISADGLCVHLMEAPENAFAAKRARLIIHLRQPIGQIKVHQLAIYTV
ncbi:hypothetical protein LGT41_0006815 [Abyssibius alkaniclasticus]|uniref:hypothetical protein n=1 Tax=Abyssibius alkaniclasticus TaxID=2881234 RepID=UPI002363E57E|nr:hypothetical protein [Abyssibius alkaniclasticus]UPH72522.1 hypothetical protein LGT41_0006815 [Abyssibius alkaniclasticus]